MPRKDTTFYSVVWHKTVKNAQKRVTKGKYYLKYTNNSIKNGIVDVTGKTIVPCRYDEVLILNDEMFIAYRFTPKGYKCGLYDKKGKKVLKCVYDKIAPLGAGFFLVEKRNMKCGVYDATGNIVVKAKYDDILYHRDLGIFVCELENDDNSVTHHYYDTEGKFLGC